MKLLLPFLLAACVQYVKHTPKEANLGTNSHLDIAKQKVTVSGNKQDARITYMKFAGRKGRFDNQVKLEANTPLKDKGKLMFSKIVFDFKHEDKEYTCTLSKEGEEDVPLMQKMPFRLDNCSNQALDPLATVFKDTGISYEKANTALPYEVEGVEGENFIFYRYSYKNKNCKLDIWIHSGTQNDQASASPRKVAVKYLIDNKHFISYVNNNLVIKGQHGNINIACSYDGFNYFNNNDNAYNYNPLFTSQMAEGKSYNPKGNNNLFLFSGKDNKLTVVATLRYTKDLKGKGSNAPVNGIEAHIYKAGSDGIIDLDNSKRTIVLRAEDEGHSH